MSEPEQKPQRKPRKAYEKSYISWSNIDIKLVKCGVLPQGRSIRACRIFCQRHNIEFIGKRQIDQLNELVKRIEERQNGQHQSKKKDFKQCQKQLL